MTKPEKEKQRDPNVVQRQASDPKVSAWVTASAGTGKTKVLTDRVLRLMLEGNKPEEILCLTFTRAAAAVMTMRIRDELSSWVSLSEPELKSRLKKLTGKTADAAVTDRARRLFAEFLETPDGMRIQTIHSFAQSLIHRFPVESGIPPYFDVMDDQTAAELLRTARADVLRQIRDSNDLALARAVHMVTPEVSEDDFITLISELTYRRGELLSIFEKHGGLEGTVDAVYKYLNAPKGFDSKTLNDKLNSNEGLKGWAPDISALGRAADILAGGTPTDLQKAKMIKAWILYPEERADLFWDYASVFLTAEGTPRARLTTKATSEAEEVLRHEARRLMEGIEEISTMNVARGTESILRLTGAILDRYAEKKKSLNLLDYDDLIHSANLMMREDNATAWVIEKLPGNLKHILVDEAQDTNPDQWALVSAIVEEFFKGPARKKSTDNTLFVVGDEKQSIFSFQRADPREFERRKKLFRDLAQKAGGEWRDIEMDIAFRSSPAITQAVDAVFANPAASDGLFSRTETGDKKVHHDPFRKGQAGIVELHPVLIGAKKEDRPPWTPPLKREDVSDPQAELADKIADRIQEMIRNKEPLPSRGRAISPSDIMILVRRRSAFVEHMVRALKKRDIPVAGADRMSLGQQIVVMDLVALGEALLFPKDDYKLACVLKSPLIGMNDAQLEKIAATRSGSLWESLEKQAQAKKSDKIYKEALEWLSSLQAELNQERPYEFYSSVLMNACPANAKSGLNALYSRLGFEAEDPLVEFMNAIEQFEKQNIPSLQGFIAWLAAGEAEVKREINLDPETPRVHIMTAHGAKGLEAPIVFLPDTTGVPDDNARARPRFLWPDHDRDVPLWVPRADLENTVFRQERHQAELERDREYRRLLYVAMTRAADRLYVYGAQNADRVHDDSWYALIKKGLAEGLANDIVQNPETGVMRFEVSQTAKQQPDGVKPHAVVKVVGIPQWARQIPEPSSQDDVNVKQFRPSDYKASNDNFSAPSPLQARSEKYRAMLGTVVHDLLEFLPVLPSDERDHAMEKYLSRPVWGITEKDQKETADQLRKILSDPEFGPLFGPNSRPEVTITAHLKRNGEQHAMTGQIDRLVVDDKSVTIIDYKNSVRVPERPEEIQKQYLVQMAAYKMALREIYPDKEIKCALLWTRAAKLMPIPGDLLDKSLEDIGVRPSAAFKKTGPKPG